MFCIEIQKDAERSGERELLLTSRFMLVLPTITIPKDRLVCMLLCKVKAVI
jgi:hypothetical protein